MKYETLKNYPKDSKIIVTVKGSKFMYYVHDLSPDFWQFLVEVADEINDEINDSN